MGPVVQSITLDGFQMYIKVGCQKLKGNWKLQAIEAATPNIPQVEAKQHACMDIES